ncbi:hypothetical protein HYPSUDRAFT_204763 [Hypholoma sublateritium FD-334 SS-4]|uniref:Uncharacterized protein n=1 Tax=Hypholoma sublateritium (strain FD-334 SS-4) TaxID=945553 RepID=A0A0D2PGI3_HYPSF|nr:hypothetical protein HYPSUDRAFT_204763 [Hypholoma sublateritium FD-334 SS-4]
MSHQVHPLDILEEITIDDDAIYEELEMLDNEIENLYMESRLNDDTPSHPVHLRSNISTVLQHMDHSAGDESDDDDTDGDFYPDSDSEDDDAHWKATCIFTEGELNKIRACLAGAVIPTWVDRLPTNLGEKAHGKLKADQWFILFSIFFPLILPEIWLSQPLLTNAAMLLDNFYQLVTCTNIVWEIDFTMLRQMCRRGRLTAYLRNTSLKLILLKSDSSPEIPDSNQKNSAKRNAGLEVVPLDIYNEILAYVNSTLQPEDLPYRHARDLPHPENAKVLPQYALRVRRFQHKGRGYTTVGLHPGNSCVSFTPAAGTAPESGHIEAIWSFNFSSADVEESHKFIVVSLHEGLSMQDSRRNPYRSKPGFLANLVYRRELTEGRGPMVIVEEKAIIGHVAYYSRPPGTFGIKRGTTVLVNSLHRYRD